jgi:hypothetical protein
MKKVNYTPSMTTSIRSKGRLLVETGQAKVMPVGGKRVRVPVDVIVEQVSASMAIEGRTLTGKLTVKPTRASKQVVADIAARSAERRRKSGNASKA